MMSVTTKQVMVSLRELVGGLVDQQQLDPVLSLQEGFTTGPHARNRYWKPGMTKGEACECVLPPTHCFRTSSQRSLDTPVTFLSSMELIPAGADAWPVLVQAINTGILDGTSALLGGEGRFFYDADNNGERERIANLVLGALRCNVCVYSQYAGPGAAADPINAVDLGEWSTSFEQSILDFVGLEVFHLSDRSEPWMSWTGLSYFCRPDNLFVPIPMVLWRDRDPACRIIDREAEAQTGPFGNNYPQIIHDEADIEYQVTLTIQGLWVPRPDVCGPYWPGELCPPHLVANTPSFMQSHHQY